jgi:hypothetical protein
MSAFGGKADIDQTQQNGALRSGQFAFNRACDSSMPSLDGAFCGVDVTIDDLKVRQTVEIATIGNFSNGSPRDLKTVHKMVLL